MKESSPFRYELQKLGTWADEVLTSHMQVSPTALSGFPFECGDKLHWSV